MKRESGFTLMEIGIALAIISLLVAFLSPGITSSVVMARMQAAVNEAVFIHASCERARKTIASSSISGYRVTHTYANYYPSWTNAGQLTALSGREIPDANGLGLPIQFQMHQNYCVVATTIPFNEGSFMGHPTEPVDADLSRVIIFASPTAKGAAAWVGAQKKILSNDPMRD